MLFIVRLSSERAASVMWRLFNSMKLLLVQRIETNLDWQCQKCQNAEISFSFKRKTGSWYGDHFAHIIDETI